MNDPVGLASAANNPNPLHADAARKLHAQRARQQGDADTANPADFKQLLEQNLAQVNRLQQDATRAVEDLAAGRRDDLETVLMATQKADTAFRMLLQVRNQVMQAYDEIKQIRV